MGRKKNKGTASAKRYGTLIRVSDAFADAVRDASSFKKISVAEYLDSRVLAFVTKDYRDEVVKEARRIEGDK